MALATYSDLQTAVAAWMARQGDSIITTNAPDFVTLCESRMAYGADDPDAPFKSKPLRIRAMETSAVIPIQATVAVSSVGGTANVITLTPGTANAAYTRGQTWSFTSLFTNTAAVTVNVSGLGQRTTLKGSALSPLSGSEIIIGQTVTIYDDGAEFILLPGTANAPLPSNYLAMRNVYLDTNPRQRLAYITPDQANIDFSSDWPDQPRKYTIEGDAIRLIDAPDSAYNFVCLYYQKFGALSSATNWLMTNKPDVYLYGSLLEACIFFQMFQQAQTYHGLFMSACNGLQNQDTIDRHSGAPLTISNDTGNP